MSNCRKKVPKFSNVFSMLTSPMPKPKKCQSIKCLKMLRQKKSKGSEILSKFINNKNGKLNQFRVCSFLLTTGQPLPLWKSLQLSESENIFVHHVPFFWKYLKSQRSTPRKLYLKFQGVHIKILFRFYGPPRPQGS